MINIPTQRDISRIFQNQLTMDRFPHAYLFTGPDLAGKITAAKEIARYFNCPEQGCGVCEECRRVEEESHPNFKYLKASSSEFLIGQIQEIIEFVSRKTFYGRQVIVISEAERMNPEAANKFLKTLEEPQQETIFLLFSPFKESIEKTIVSRCQVVNFRNPDAKLVEGILIEKGESKNDAGLITRLAGNDVLLALDISARKPESLSLIEVVLKLLKEAGVMKYHDALSISAKITPRSNVKSDSLVDDEQIETIRAFAMDRKHEKRMIDAEQKRLERLTNKLMRNDLFFILDIFASIFRDMLLLKRSDDVRGLILREFSSEIGGISSLYEAESILRMLKLIRKFKEMSKLNIRNQDIMDMLILKIMEVN